MLKGLVFNISFIIATVLSLAYSFSHYGDGGCDGGLCGLGIIFQGLPLLMAWFFLIIALNFCLIKTKTFFLFFALSFFCNLLIFFIFGNEHNRVLLGPSTILLMVQCALLFYFFILKGEDGKKDTTNTL